MTQESVKLAIIGGEQWKVPMPGRRFMKLVAEVSG